MLVLQPLVTWLIDFNYSLIMGIFNACLQNANTEFCQAKSSNQSAAQRETLLKDLASGFDNYMELKSNLEEGTKV